MPLRCYTGVLMCMFGDLTTPKAILFEVGEKFVSSPKYILLGRIQQVDRATTIAPKYTY